MVLGLTVNINGDTKDLDKALGKASGGIVGFGDGALGTAAKLLPVAAAAGAAALAISSMTNAAAEDAAQQARLEAAVTAAGAATSTSNAQIEQAIALGQERAFSDDQTREALMSLVTATGDVTAATGLLATAQDVARFANVDLATAADAVAKAQAGQDTALTRMIPGLEKGVTATDTLANAQRIAAGQAVAYGNSTAGAQAKAGDAMGELSETIGSALLPALDAILPALTPMIKSLGTLVTAVLPLLIPLLRLLGVVLGIVAKALTTVVGWITTLVSWLTRAIGVVGDLLSKIGPLRDLGNLVGGIVGNLSTGSVAATTAARGARAGTTGGGGGGVTINITATGDSLATEAAVLKALRRSSRLNAGTLPAWSAG